MLSLGLPDREEVPFDLIMFDLRDFLGQPTS
jgi:hypothetical protein